MAIEMLLGSEAEHVMPHKLTRAQKHQARMRYRAGEAVSKIAADLGCSYSNIRNLIRRYGERPRQTHYLIWLRMYARYLGKPLRT